MAYHRTRYFRRFRVTFNITTQHNSTTITLPISVCTSLRLVLKKSVKHIRSLRTSKVVWRSSKICTFRCRRYKSKGCNIQKGHVEIVILQDHHKKCNPHKHNGCTKKIYSQDYKKCDYFTRDHVYKNKWWETVWFTQELNKTTYNLPLAPRC